jgi:hypothetical protein
VLFYLTFYNIPNRLVGIAENRQKTAETRQKAVKIPPTAAPISTKRFVLHSCHIFELHTKFQVSSLYRSRDFVELHRKKPKSGKIPPSVAPILTKVLCRILVTFDSYIPNFKSLALTVLEILFTDRRTDRHTDQWLKFWI